MLFDSRLRTIMRSPLHRELGRIGQRHSRPMHRYESDAAAKIQRRLNVDHRGHAGGLAIGWTVAATLMELRIGWTVSTTIMGAVTDTHRCDERSPIVSREGSKLGTCLTHYNYK